MPATIKIKNSSTTGAVPTSSDLVQGELAVNVTDLGLYTENASGTVVKLNAPSIDDKNTGATKHLTISTSGNLGLGVTPSAWNSDYRALDVSNYGNLYGRIATPNVGVVLNGYRNSGGSWIYKTTNAAARYEQDSGFHIWYTAATGTAGNAISFTQAMTLDTSGNLLVASTNSSTSSGSGIKLNADGKIGVVATTAALGDTYNYYNSTAGAYRFYVNNAGTIFATSTTISAISDERLKENIRDIDTGLDAVMALKPRRFDWKEGKGQNKNNAAGFIAQEFEIVFPDSVGTSKAGDDGIEYKNICHEELIPTLVKAIQELKAEIDALKGQA